MTGYMISWAEPSRGWPSGCWNLYAISTTAQHVYLGTFETIVQLTDAMAVDHACRPKATTTV